MNNKDIARKYLNGSWDKNPAVRESVIDELVSEGCVASGPMTEHFQGREGYKAFVSLFLGAFDVRFDVGEPVVEGDIVSTHVVYTGKNVGEFNGQPATGRMTVVPVDVSLQIKEGQIVASLVQWDPDDLMRQLYS